MISSYTKKPLQILISFVILFAFTSFAEAAEGPKDLKCPKLTGTNPPEVFRGINIKAMNFNGQYLQRVEPESNNVIQDPVGIVGCYKYFSSNTGYDAGWDVGIIDFINGGFKWINYVGANWEMIPDFENNRFITNKTNPYYPAPFNILRSFKPISGNSSSCKQFRIRDIGFPPKEPTVNLTPNPLYLAVVIDFQERYVESVDKELERFEFSKVENFWTKNSYGKSRLEIEEFNQAIYIQESSKSFEGGSEWKLFPKVIAELSKKLDLTKYSGFIFLTSAKGPRLQAGYASTVNVGQDLKPLTWMGGWNPIIENWVPAWKVVAHEIGHNYGLPDLYMTNGDNSAGKTLGPFDIMDGVTGISNSITFYHRWMLGWLSDDKVLCSLPGEEPFSVELTPISDGENGVKGTIIPLSEFESILIEARVNSEFDELKSDQEGILVYRVDTRVPGGRGPLAIIPSKNDWTNNPKILDDVERFKYGTLRLGERVNYADIFVESSRRSGEKFVITLTKGDNYFRAKAAAELKAKQEAEAKAAAEKAATVTSTKKKITITCIKGKTVKKVTAINPKCPKGFKNI